MPEVFADHCYKDGACRTPDGRSLAACPTRAREVDTYSERAPLLLSEDMCLAGLERARVLKPMKDPFKDLCREAELTLEHALALPFSHVAAAKPALFGQAVQYIGECLREEDIFSKSRLPYAMRNERLSLFLPAFKDRLGIFDVDQRTMAQVHRALCASLEVFDERYLRQLSRRDHVSRKFVIAEKTEREVYGLLTRLKSTDSFPWPVFGREEASQARSEHNHDGYVVRRNSKIPFQIKESKSGSGYKGVVIIRHYDILRAMQREHTTIKKRWEPRKNSPDYVWPSDYSYEEILAGTKPDPIAELLVEEVNQGSAFDPTKKNVLNLASSYVLSRLNEFTH